jgi:hypothetical protein
MEKIVGLTLPVAQAGVVERADTSRLNRDAYACRFDSCHRHTAGVMQWQTSHTQTMSDVSSTLTASTWPS